MLYKAELKEVPLCVCPTYSKKELPKDEILLAASALYDLRRSGKILVVDYYTSKKRKLQARFFSDGKRHIVYLQERDTWSSAAPDNLLKHDMSVESQEDIERISGFLNVKFYGDTPRFYNYARCAGIKGSLALCCEFAYENRREENQKRLDRKYAREHAHRAMFPKRYPDSFVDFCERKVFQTTYISYGKLNEKRKRKGMCLSCRKTVTLPAETKHNTLTHCPKCGRPALLVAEWRGTQFEETATVCYPLKKDGQLLLEWSKVTRTLSKMEKVPDYYAEPFARTLYLIEDGKPKIYSYGISNGFGHYDWCSWGNRPVYRNAYVYDKDLTSVFGESYYNVDLKAVLDAESSPVDLVQLLDNLKGYPQTEYLCKLGMTAFASQFEAGDIDLDGEDFCAAFGVPNHCIALYRDKKVTVEEHRHLRYAKEPITDDMIDRYREMKKRCGLYGSYKIPYLLARMSIQKLTAYVEKQQGTVAQILEWMDDYYQMSESIGVTLNRKNMFPADIKQAHDTLSERCEALRAELEAEASRHALSLVNDFFHGYSKDGFTVVVPKSREDFIREGQELSHCVGSVKRYYDDHVAGTKMIFFIRAAARPEIALYTAQIDMMTYTVIQLYGYGDKLAPPKVRSFTNAFARWMKQKSASLCLKEAV